MAENPPSTKVRFFPSGMIEVSGSDANETALIGAEIAKGMFGKRQTVPSQPEPELPLTNGKVDREPFDHSPFYDETVNQAHPAVKSLEKKIMQASAGSRFEYHEMRQFIGHEITGVYRECMTRAVGNLMARLEELGVVTRLSRYEWQKSHKVT